MFRPTATARLPFVVSAAIGVWLAAAVAWGGDGREIGGGTDGSTASLVHHADQVAAIAAAVDSRLAAAWAAEGVEPAEPASDAAWFRRVHLDLTGRVPAASAVRDFLNANPEGSDAAARAAVVERLLDGPGYVTHFTAIWRDALVPELDRDPQAAFLRPGFEAWLRQALLDDQPYGEFVRELLTADVTPTEGMIQNGFPDPTAAGPRAFYQAKNVAPEELAAATTRAFLGTRLECAECHDHPFDHWKQDQFWRFAAFFGGLERAEGRRLGELRERTDATVLKLPESVTLAGGETELPATYLDGTAPRFLPGQTPRAVLADRLTAPENELFARVAVNRLWGQAFGRGLVDPVDDFGAANPASHPELLDELAGLFVASGYDMKTLLAGLCGSEAYRLSSAHPGDPPADLFARYPVKPLPAAVLYDCLERATGGFTPFGPGGGRQVFAMNDDPRGEFLRTFRDDAEGPADRRTSILQALSLMNGGVVAESLDLARSRTLAAVADAPYLDRDGKLDALFLATVSRSPTADERAELNAHAHALGDDPAALADVFWALLNGSEFSTNH